jgi:hypothetical protein
LGKLTIILALSQQGLVTFLPSAAWARLLNVILSWIVHLSAMLGEGADKEQEA